MADLVAVAGHAVVTVDPDDRRPATVGREAVMVDRRDVIPGAAPDGPRRWSRIEDLCCPVCRRGVRAKPPGYWKVADGPLPQWSHRDGRALCVLETDDGPWRANPVRRDRAIRSMRAAFKRDPSAISWTDRRLP